MRRHRHITQGRCTPRQIAIGFNGAADGRQRQFQLLPPLTDHIHVGRALARRAGEALAGFFIDNALGHLFVERPHRPVQPAQRSAPFRIVGRRQRIFRIIGFQMIDDRPQAFGPGSIHIHEDRQAIARIFRQDGIAGDALFRHHQTGQAATGRQHQMNQAAHRFL